MHVFAVEYETRSGVFLKSVHGNKKTFAKRSLCAGKKVVHVALRICKWSCVINGPSNWFLFEDTVELFRTTVKLVVDAISL